MPTVADYATRVLARIEVTPEGCWRWTGHLSPVRGTGVLHNGYGQCGQNRMTHRVVWEHLRGPIPAGLVLDHECHNRDLTCAGGPTCLHRRCVNPDHLAPKTTRENTFASSVSVTSVNAAKMYCPEGHEYTDENTYFRPDRPGRLCRICRYEAGRRCNAKPEQRERNRRTARAWRERMLAEDRIPHGTAYGSKIGCRCQPCRDAAVAARLEKRTRAAEYRAAS